MINMSDFIQMWQTYQIAIDNNNLARQVNYISKFGGYRPLYLIINVDKLKELKSSTMLEF